MVAEGKPAEIERALHALQSYVWSVKHGSAPFDARLTRAIPDVARHAKPLPGKVKTTKVQIAARDALEAYRAMGDKLDAATRAEVDRACTDMKRIG